MYTKARCAWRRGGTGSAHVDGQDGGRGTKVGWKTDFQAKDYRCYLNASLGATFELKEVQEQSG